MSAPALKTVPLRTAGQRSPYRARGIHIVIANRRPLARSGGARFLVPYRGKALPVPASDSDGYLERVLSRGCAVWMVSVFTQFMGPVARAALGGGSSKALTERAKGSAVA